MAGDPGTTTTVRRVGGGRPAPTVRAQRELSRIRRVLVVEDNPVNQELAQSMLLELGVDAVSAWSGEEALVKMAADEFEVVLMDCQMPKLDGYATTRRIREWERRSGRDRTPIIAVTANALSGDSAKCFEAGMDRYLSKPFTIEQLLRTLNSCAPDEPLDEGAAPSDMAALDESTLDQIRELHKQGGPNLLAKLAGLYLPSSQTQLDGIRAALGARDAAGVAGGAHALKSSSSSIGATVLAELCANLEAAGRSASLNGADLVLAKLVDEHGRVLKALEALATAT